MVDVFDALQVMELEMPLPDDLVSTRQGASKSLRYIEGHIAIDNANQIFGYGKWGSEALSCDMVILTDPLSGEAIGVEYKATVRVWVSGMEQSIIEIGSQPVATWNVYDQVMNRRESQAKYNKTTPDYNAEITRAERKSACAVIAEAHEQAKKGAVTDAMKRGLRLFGAQFGNTLYGDGSRVVRKRTKIQSLTKIRELAEKFWDGGYTDLAQTLLIDPACDVVDEVTRSVMTRMLKTQISQKKSERVA